MAHYQYLAELAACLLVTLPLEFLFGARVWRQPRRLALSVLPLALVFSMYDIYSIRAGWWYYAARYVTGIDLPGHLPIEEVLFFIVVPICAILSFEAVKATPTLFNRHLRSRGSKGEA